MSLIPIMMFAPKPVLTFKNHYEDPANLTTYSFTSVDIGNAAGGRKVIIGISGGENTRTVTSCTINGVTGTQVIQIQSAAETAALYIAAVPAGTGLVTVDIVWSGAQTSCGIGVWTALNIPLTAIDSKSSSASPGTGTLTTKAGGFVVGLAGMSSIGGGTSTWTNLTERFDSIQEGTQVYSGADVVTTGTSLAVTATYAAGGNHSLVAASWG